MVTSKKYIPSRNELLKNVFIGNHPNMVTCLTHSIWVNYLVPTSSYSDKLRDRMFQLYRDDFHIYSKGASNVESARNWRLIFKNYNHFTAESLIGFQGAVLCHPDLLEMSSFNSDFGILNRISITNERHKKWLN